MEDDDVEQKPRRQKRETSYKAKAFERFKQLKSGNRKKYEIEELDSVYETVDEREYTKRVLDRQDDDWIVDDDGSGYVEDGREIFDDDLDAESIKQAKFKNKDSKKKSKRKFSDDGPKGNIQYMLSNLKGKKTQENQIGDDELLADVLEELDASPVKPANKKFKPYIPKKQEAQSYLKKFSIQSKHAKSDKPPIEVLKDEYDAGVEMGDSIPDDDASQIISESIDPKPESETQVEIDEDFGDDLDISQIEQIESQMEQNHTVMQKESKIKAEKVVPKSEDDDFSDILTSRMFEDNAFDEDFKQAEIDEPFVMDDKNVFRFFWWDAFEDPEKQKGTVFLFGKTYDQTIKTYGSCCVAVKNLNRQIFLLPRKYILDDGDNQTDVPVTYKDLYMEFTSLIAEPMQIKTFKARLVQKKYAFDSMVPHESDYLEVIYPVTEPKINLDLISRTPKTFSRIFGLNTSQLEKFLLESKIKGPCWLDIKNPETNRNPLSWCKYEISCSSVKDVMKVDESIPPPPLTVSAINMRCFLNEQTYQTEIMMISCVTQSNYSVSKKQPDKAFDQHFCVISPHTQWPLPDSFHHVLKFYKVTKVQKMNTEKALLNYFITQFSKLDPDLIVGHDLQGHKIDILAQRLAKHDISGFSKFSKLKRTQRKKLERELFTGRLVADIKTSAKELIKSRSYDLNALCQEILKIPESEIVDLEMDEIMKLYKSSEGLLRLINYTMQDSAYILKIMYDLNIIPLALQITTIAGNLMSRTLMGGRSERNEFLLMHAFYEKGYIMPDKAFRRRDENATKKKAGYSGGLVLEPKVGFYDKLLLLMDFNSLYPSIIQEYNICFTTLPISEDENNLVLPDKGLPPGILPVEIRKLVDSRKQVKGLMNNPDISPDLRMQYHIRQMALKLTANSMYGCLGFSNSRFHAKNLAALVTYKGREILTNTKELVEKMCYEVVYGDTDSIMINTNMLDYDQVMKIGFKIKQEVNKLYKMVELDIDGIFKYLLLLKKKKYAAVKLTKTKDGKLKEEKEYKGLDIVRRDWSQIAAEAGKYVLEHILSDQSEEERINNIQSYLSKVKDELKANKVPLALLEITKQITKDPKMYPNKDSLPHVQVALRMNGRGQSYYRAGDTVPYIICDDKTNRPATQRGYHFEEIKFPANEPLVPDINYYLGQQIHPVVTRICEPIEGIDAYQIADWLELDTSAFKKPVMKSVHSAGENITRPEVKFRYVTKFSFKCLQCQTPNPVNSPMNGDTPVLAQCSNSECSAKPIDYLFYVKNQLTCAINSFIMKYYENKLICENPGCDNITTRMPLEFRGGKYPRCTGCLNALMYRDYSECMLYYQLSYYVYIFDLQAMDKKPLLEERLHTGFQELRETAEKYLSVSGYSVVNLNDIFNIVLEEKDAKRQAELDYLFSRDVEDSIEDSSDEE